MDLLKLDANYQAGPLVENFDSLIWTERFNTVGDFQLTTGFTDQFMTLLPEDTALSLRETNHTFLVETHEIEREKGKPEKLTIKGRSFESILDRRAAIQAVSSLVGSTNWTVNVKTASDAAYYIINKICVEGLVDLKDIFPSAKVQFVTPTDYLTGTGPTRAFDIPRGNLLTQVLTFLQTEAAADPTTTPVTPAVVPHGIRAIRPNAAGTAVGIQIYKGTDRSDTVYFDATRDLLDNGKYLFSKVGSANVGYGVLANNSAKMFEGAVEPTGFDRRVMLVDGSTSGIGDLSVLKAQMSTSLAEAKETAMFDGQINEDINPYTYGVDYFLGDIVKVVGDYGLDEYARVTEYIRSIDSKGYRAFPTLTTVDKP